VLSTPVIVISLNTVMTEIKENYKVHKILELLITELVVRKVLDESNAKNIIEVALAS
jgi:hypothetical protein